MKWINENWKGLLVVAAFGYLGWTIYNGLADNARAEKSSAPKSMADKILEDARRGY